MDRRSFLKKSGQVSLAFGAAPAFAQNSATSANGIFVRTPAISLDGEWAIAKDEHNVGVGENSFGGPVQGAEKARVPGILQETFPLYHGRVWYWKQLLIDSKAPPAGRYLLHFGAVDYACKVWVNGVAAGDHEGGETDFTLDVTGSIRPGQQNTVAVRVLNPSNTPMDGINLAEIPHSNNEQGYH